MKVQENISLKSFNTFGIDSIAKFFVAIKSVEGLKELLFLQSMRKETKLVLGGGSNILFTKNYNGLVIKNEIAGIETIKEDAEYIYVKVGAGVNWHSFVLHCIEHNWGGVENLALIPGTVGAAPIQNIGAYGVELKNVFFSLEAFEINEKVVHNFSLNDCAFGYRDSVFKNKFKNQFVILSTSFRLRKFPIFNIEYGAIQQELEKNAEKKLSVKTICQAVINIRKSKLPDPEIIGNAGSFFKNPEISSEEFEKLKVLFPTIVSYELANGNKKLAAGWLVEQCGPNAGVTWKGYRVGDAGCHEKQALVLVNHGNSNGKEIYNLSEAVLETVYQKFGITLEREVNIF